MYPASKPEKPPIIFEQIIAIKVHKNTEIAQYLNSLFVAPKIVAPIFTGRTVNEKSTKNNRATDSV